MEELEHEMELLGITGVEDKLQDEVAMTIQKLRQGGIQVWMLTGDKIETAKCIAIQPFWLFGQQPDRECRYP